MSDDARLRRIWADVPAEGDHVDEGTWELFACGELAAAERARLVVKHVSACAPCAQTYRAVVALATEARILDPSLPAPSPPPREARPRRRPALWAASGAFAAAAAVVLAVSWPRDRPIDTMRGGEAAQIELAMPAPAHATWPAVAGADRYRASVYTDDGRVAWTTTSSAPEANWPAPRAGSYTFVVEALRGGKIVARSRLTPFVVPR